MLQSFPASCMVEAFLFAIFENADDFVLVCPSRLYFTVLQNSERLKSTLCAGVEDSH